MDLVVLALTFLLQHPDLAIAGAKSLTRPGAVDVNSIQVSFADLTRGILHCYHRTARYQIADVLEKPWSRQNQYGAENSALVTIRYVGVTNTPYTMNVAILSKGNLIRTAVISDTARVPYSKRCQLENWSGPR